MEKSRGALVADVIQGGPADHSGIRVRDVITEYDGKAIKQAGDFPLLVARTAAEKKVGVKILRDNKEIPLEVTIGELSEKPTGEQSSKSR
jgi:serine protease Do